MKTGYLDRLFYETAEVKFHSNGLPIKKWYPMKKNAFNIRIYYEGLKLKKQKGTISESEQKITDRIEAMIVKLK